MGLRLFLIPAALSLALLLPGACRAQVLPETGVTPIMTKALVGAMKESPPLPPGANKIHHELKRMIGDTIALATEGKQYQEVVAHIGKLPANTQKLIDIGEPILIIKPTSDLFQEVIIHLGTKPGMRERVIAFEFFSKKGSFSMDDMRAVFGEWRRSPKEPSEASFAVAWFPRYDPSSGARYFLYAEDGEYKTRIDPKKTPERIFIQMEQFRWGD